MADTSTTVGTAHDSITNFVENHKALVIGGVVLVVLVIGGMLLSKSKSGATVNPNAMPGGDLSGLPTDANGNHLVYIPTSTNFDTSNIGADFSNDPNLKSISTGAITTNSPNNSTNTSTSTTTTTTTTPPPVIVPPVVVPPVRSGDNDDRHKRSFGPVPVGGHLPNVDPGVGGLPNGHHIPVDIPPPHGGPMIKVAVSPRTMPPVIVPAPRHSPPPPQPVPVLPANKGLVWAKTVPMGGQSVTQLAATTTRQLRAQGMPGSLSVSHHTLLANNPHLTDAPANMMQVHQGKNAIVPVWQ